MGLIRKVFRVVYLDRYFIGIFDTSILTFVILFFYLEIGYSLPLYEFFILAVVASVFTTFLLYFICVYDEWATEKLRKFYRKFFSIEPEQ